MCTTHCVRTYPVAAAGKLGLVIAPSVALNGRLCALGGVYPRAYVPSTRCVHVSTRAGNITFTLHTSGTRLVFIREIENCIK